MEDKIIRDIDRLVQISNKLKAEGNKIVFGNGCFDILHVGHIRYLKGAKELGDYLIIAVNSDSSARTIKRPDGLVIPEDERLEILAAIEHIDYVTIFAEPTVENLLLKLKPHIHAKGTDYTKETVPERDTVASYGGQIAIVGDAKNHSSTEIKSRIN
ncbi:MAG: adenylyltransferase/cytidyltransferase family protein [Candidatus Anammoxibacter sp.]